MPIPSTMERLHAFDAERRHEQAQLIRHYSMQEKCWPWEEPLPTLHADADTIVRMADAVKLAIAQQRQTTTTPGVYSPVEVRLGTRSERDQLLNLLPQDMRALVRIVVDENLLQTV
jgi:hypothetical protein